ncbi:DUF6268 family outer membrane beta-barrel protein [Psychroserpens sp.]|uniref:DUF6268 family outer membrane beta-barrel protein n=1 Tax=Psychroserpens sp. TaxID=2020870 RepID=UPI001B1ECF0E|nr:DUF6268 family outer membrane beta-barrel protein [Psychroserpens sp.]MBO6607148.1 hypothetical protein [Psychroserpens sp.]MBO6632115.1 hypothetical protein [Psychroserpens sp.]MBO6654294.1 hypothetical protein [Psychroserpens sp.]MBO6682420.1 hypothetical protein [Psychroserpens sp.]MBO6750920.1 hypothetical protein [Psychroserpens sp.]
MLKSISKIVLLVFIGCTSQLSTAQLTDLARLEYSFIPKSNSEDQYTRVRALLNYPIKTKEDCYLVIGAEYNQIFLNLEDDYPFDVSLIESVKVIDLNIGYTFKTSEKWRIGLNLNPRLASTFTSSLESDDLFLNGGIFAINDRTKDESAKRPYRLTLGLTYNTTAGIPFPLPFVSYYRRVNEKWSFSAGIPKSNVKYFLSEKSMLQTFVSLDGYFAHIQRPLVINGTQVDNVSLSVAVGGLGYEYFITKNLVAYAYSGFTFRLNNVLRNDNRDEVFKLDDLNAFYLRTGIKFKL